MARQYKQLSLKERHEIEKALDGNESFRSIARLIGREPSTVSREIRENRHMKAERRGSSVPCREKDWCQRGGVCATCLRPGAKCAGCDARDCRDECPTYAAQGSCGRLAGAPWVCNGCRKYRYGCNRRNRYVYDADVAHKGSSERRSDSRSGIDMDPERAEAALARIKDGVSRGLSPYEISVLYSDEVGVHQSTIYRWVERGYGGLTNLELERKVGFRPRRKTGGRKSTSHSKKRSYGAFCELPEEVRASRSELDCVIGRQVDTQAVLTVYNLPTHVQLALLLDAHDCDNVKRGLESLKGLAPDALWQAWFSLALTDNGEEFADEDGIGEILGEEKQGGKLKVRLYYCDPRQSQQKGGCEKNHTEVRQLLEKGMFVFDELTGRDLSVVMSHVNSNPRASLGGKSPIQMLRFIHGEEAAQALLDGLGIEEIGRDELMLKPEILDIERAKRGEPPLTRLK